MRKSQRRSKAVRPCAALVALALLSACGTQVDHDRIVAAAGVATGARDGSTGASGTDQANGELAPSDVLVDGGTASGGTAPSVASTGGTSGGAAGASAAGTRAANLSLITIGNIGSYSGVVGSIFPGKAAALQAWAQTVNTRGGLNGHPVRIVSGDDGGDPARALALARQMVEQQGAIAFLGNMVPLSLPAVRTYLEDKNIPLVGGDVTLPDWIESPVIFPSGTDVQSISRASVDLLAGAGGTKLAVLFCGESPSCKGLADDAQSVPVPGMPVVYTAQISLVQTDFTTECLQAQSKGADAIFVAADANTVIRVGRSCSQQGIKPIYGTASIAVGYQLADDPNMEGLIAPTNNAPWFDTSTPGGAEFSQAMKTYGGGSPMTGPAASMYASGLILEAASKGLSANPTSAELLAGLRGLKGETAKGMSPALTFRNGPTGKISCYFVVKVQGGRWVAPNGANPVCLK